MGFKENLLQKLEIDRLSKKVVASVTPPADGAKFDRQSMRRLLETGAFRKVTYEQRGLELYVLENDRERKKIIVLDNGLAIYHTTLDDVALRKSPTVKEMISIRNAVKILSDKDVLLSKRGESVAVVREKLIAGLDLSFTEADIAAIEAEGAASLENGYREGVLESLALFAELLDYRKAPKPFRMPQQEVLGMVSHTADGQLRFGPMFIYSNPFNTLKWVDQGVAADDLGQLEGLKRIATGKEKATLEGADVLHRLREAVLEKGTYP
jgi:hypothetical protein